MAKFQTKAFTGRKPIVLPDGADPEWINVEVEFPATAPAANDLIELCELPIGYRVLDWVEIFPDIDSNAAPALAHSLGIENAGGTDLGTEVWVTGSTAGQSNAIVRNGTSIAAQGDISTARKLAMKITTAAATYAGAGKTGQLLLLVQA